MKLTFDLSPEYADQLAKLAVRLGRTPEQVAQYVYLNGLVRIANLTESGDPMPNMTDDRVKVSVEAPVKQKAAWGTSNQIVEHYTELIWSGRLAPGSVLGTSSGLARELNISRTTMRHVLNGLANRGLIEHDHLAGTVWVRQRDVLGRPCDVCGKRKRDVTHRPDAYARDVDNKPFATYDTCDACDKQRREDI